MIERMNGILERERGRDRRPSERGRGCPLGNDGTHHSGREIILDQPVGFLEGLGCWQPFVTDMHVTYEMIRVGEDTF